mmetsp:Transcript_6703/g.9978  ORF Transcript_6703/g.9978 Transcript_6703/m.9978 type:complete len:269 (+) Transcript_6703:336-1142(+)
MLDGAVACLLYHSRLAPEKPPAPPSSFLSLSWQFYGSRWPPSSSPLPSPSLSSNSSLRPAPPSPPLVVHVGLHAGGVHRPLWQIRAEGWRRGCAQQRCLPLGPFAADLAVHGQRAPLAHGRRPALLAQLQQLHRRPRRQALIVVVVQLDHGRVGAGPQALHLPQGEQPVRRGLAVPDAQVVRDGALDVLRAADHAGRGPAQLDEVLPQLLPVEHGVEGGDLVDGHGRGAHHLRNLVHRRHRQPAPVLSLSKIKQRDDCPLLEVLWVLS